jgi:hypothetical protein
LRQDKEVEEKLDIIKVSDCPREEKERDEASDKRVMMVFVDLTLSVVKMAN